jgi:hypothetical protein
MPRQLRDVANRAERDDLVTVRVIPFEAGAYSGGLFGTFTLLELEEGLEEGLSDVLFLDADRGAFTMITGGDLQMAKYKEEFEDLLQDALSAEESIELIRNVADQMS